MSVVSPAPFRFTTKAGNLSQLRNRLQGAQTVDQTVVRVGDWRRDRRECVERIQRQFRDTKIIVRSSAPGEDSKEASMAGAFESILDVDSTNQESIGHAVDEVAASYAARRTGNISAYEILVQPMVKSVKASGVAFTRDLDKGGPYYLLNYDDESERTDSVTAGNAANHKVVRIFKGVDASRLDPILRAIVLAARELETVTGTDALDIEFAVDDRNVLYVLQVRPLAQTRILSFQRLDAAIAAEIRHAEEFVTAKSGPRPHLFGRSTVFGEMPDWNPAEIIGTQPKPLATSLYSFIIMKSVWREARHLTGYRHPFPYQLLVEVAGRPYVDVRCSFNSFLPATLRPELCEKLVNHYLDRLQQHPEFHDKIEFEIVLSSLDFNFVQQANRLEANGFSRDEIDEVRSALLRLTDDIVGDRHGVLRRLATDVQQLQPRRAAIFSSRTRASSLPMLVEQLLEDCIEYGTLPFSVFARCAFIANSFLRSLVQRGILSTTELNDYLHSIQTVAGDFVEDLGRCKAGALDLETFLERYGHLRPGTYDICAHSYSEKPELYLGLKRNSDQRIAPFNSHAGTQRSPVSFSRKVVAQLEKIIPELGFTFDVETLNQFIVTAIQQREAVKFEFTKNLSAAMSLLVEFGQYHGFSRESLSFLPIETFLSLANRSVSADWLAGARETADRNRNRYELTGSMNLPDLIFSTADIAVISLQRRRPNFVTQKRVIARTVQLDAASGFRHVPDLSGCVVLIENADPGFDWLFARNIGGLITKHGGAASHMTIRCAELGLPAAIGCGEQIFEELAKATSVLLDCAERRVEAHAT